MSEWKMVRQKINVERQMIIGKAIFVMLFAVFYLLAMPQTFSATRGASPARSGVRGAVKAPAAATAATPAASAEVKVAADEISNDPDPGPDPDPVEPQLEVENKSSDFAEKFGLTMSAGDETPLQKMIREQREKMGMGVASDNGQQGTKSAQAKIGEDTAVQCDKNLRDCMAGKCGDTDFSKCYNDSDTDWGSKINSCRRDTKCTGEEFAALSVEINADRKQNYELAGFNETINCGKTYNACIRDICGNDEYTRCIARNGAPTKCKDFAKSYEKCWSKSGGDNAIAACEKEYKKCQEADSGLQSRAMEVFANLR
ncbi:MAG: hypothetical protein LBD94_03540, partial [Rickettsiales bacterium]|nr:hypothetical protein [Rickettsiales bacterium]